MMSAEKRRGVNWACSLAAMAVFPWLAWAVRVGHARAFDGAARDLVHRCAFPLLTFLMRAASFLASTWFLLGAGGAIVFGMFYCGRRRSAAVFSATAAGGFFLDMALKAGFPRTRPEPFFGTPLPASSSFPSGHALLAVCFYGALAALAASGLRGPGRRRALWALVVLLVVLIGVSRIYLGVHYPTDVLAGYAAGIAWTCFASAVFPRP